MGLSLDVSEFLKLFYQECLSRYRFRLPWTFDISTTSAHKLLGVVYVPNALLSIEGNDRVAEASAWTVIVARAVSLSGSADLTVNANYGIGSVPVPSGVGPTGGTSIQLIN